MKLQTVQIEKLARRIISQLKEKKFMVLKVPEHDVFSKMVEHITADFKREDALNAEVNRMCDDLEDKNPGLDRRKMFGLIKQKLAKERKIVL